MRKVLIPAFAGIILGGIARRIELNQTVEFIVAFAGARGREGYPAISENTGCSV